MGTNKVSVLWTNFTNDIASITVPAVAWETRVKEIVQLTPQITVEGETTAATYRTWPYPVDLNDKGARERDIEIGYGFMSYFGDVYSIIAVGLDGSIDISDDALTGYCPPSGRPAMIYSSTSPIKPPPAPPPAVVSTRWIEVDLACTLDINGFNTGIQTGISKKQALNVITGLWQDTGEQVAISRTNYSDCPPPVPPAPDPYFIAVCVNFNDYWFPTEVVYPFPKSTINTPTKTGYNHLFISSPTALGQPQISQDGKNITYQFEFYSSDNRIGYQPNTIWKRKSTSVTTISTTINIVYL